MMSVSRILHPFGASVVRVLRNKRHASERCNTLMTSRGSVGAECGDSQGQGSGDKNKKNKGKSFSSSSSVKQQVYHGRNILFLCSIQFAVVNI